MPVTTEKEFLAQWEKNHSKPQKEELMAGWYKERDQALGLWRVEQEREEKKQRREQEASQKKKKYLDYLNYVRITGKTAELPPYLQGVQPFDEMSFEQEDFSGGMGLATTLVCLENLAELDELSERMFKAMKTDAPESAYGAIWKDMATRHKADVISMRQLSQRGQCAKLADKVQVTLDHLVKDALEPNWKKMNLLHYVGEQMVKTFYTMDDSRSPELRNVRKTFQERDRNSVMQKFYALKRMTEILTVYEKITEKLKDRSLRKERFSEQELKEFLLGSYVSNELSKSITKKELTKEAMRFGVLHTKVNSAGGREVTYGDEEVVHELENTASYRKMQGMTIGEISDMLRNKLEQEKVIKSPRTMVKENIHMNTRK